MSTNDTHGMPPSPPPPPSPYKKTNDDYANDFFNEQYHNYGILKLCISPPNPELTQLYASAIQEHNTQLDTNVFMNSGFDLFMPEDVTISTPFVAQFLHLGVKTEFIHCQVNAHESREIDGISYANGFYLYPRSSISKTPLMLANHVGIIDSGYRGELIAAVRSLQAEPYVVAKHTRLFQICHPQLLPVYVVLVEEAELTVTARGDGAFGSTGGTNPATA